MSGAVKFVQVGLILGLAFLGRTESLDDARSPLQRARFEVKVPGIAKEIIGYKDGEPVYYDPQPEIDPIGEGKYAFRWTGMRGQRLSVIYQRPDLVDVIVEAQVQALSAENFQYTYRLRNLKTSEERLSGFVIQTFSPRAQAEKRIGIGIADMTNSVKEFRDGRWIFFGFLPDQTIIKPGEEILVALTSPDPPGLVECRAYGGSLGIKGVGEEMPSALENAIPGYEVWPRGYSVGPDSRLQKLSALERAVSLARFLPEVFRLGWIRDRNALQWYEDNLNSGKLADVTRRARRDFQQGKITSEVVSLLRAWDHTGR